MGARFAWQCLLLVCTISLPTLVNGAQLKLEGIKQQLATIDTQQAQIDYLSSLQQDINQLAVNEQAEYWFLLGTSQDQAMQVEAGINSYSRSINLAEQHTPDNHSLLAQAYIDRSYLKYLKTFDTNVYCPDRRQALQYAQLSEQQQLVVKVLVQLAFCYGQKVEELPQGLSLLEQAIQTGQEIKLSPNQYAMIYNATANLYQQNRLPAKAYEYTQKAYQQWAKVSDTADMFNMLFSMSNMSIESLNFEQAQDHINEMKSMAKQFPDFKDFAFFAHLQQGELFLSEEKYNGALTNYNAAIEQQQYTQEKYFIGIAKLGKIISLFKLQRHKENKSHVQNFRQTHPKLYAKSTHLQAINTYYEQKPDEALQLMYQFALSQQTIRREHARTSEKSAKLLHDKVMADMDKRLMQETLALRENQLNDQKKLTKLTNQLLVSITVASLLLLSLAFYLYYTKKMFQKKALTDELTGIANRRYIFQIGDTLLKSANKTSSPLSLVVFDVDHFKQVNDKFGHDYGDKALIKIVQATTNTLRKGEYIGRIGGEEFLVLLPDVDLAEAANIAERLRQSVAGQYLTNEEGTHQLNISLGVAQSQKGEALSSVVARADNALYKAKQEGRNRVKTVSVLQS